MPFAGLSPQDACDKASLPPGFKMHVFAGEPDIRQPIAFCVDDRGRVWVAAGYSGHGNVLGLACGDLVARSILGEPVPELALFDPARLL